MKRAMFFLVAAPIVLAASGMATTACKGGPDDGDAGGDLGSLDKSSGSEDCIDKGEHEDAACPEDGGAGD